MSYLEDILKSTSATQSSIKRRKGSIQTLLSAVAPAPVAATPGVGATASPTGHSAGGLNGDFNSQLNQMIKDSGGKISVGSGYRDIAQQTDLYNRWKAGTYKVPRVAKPGSSNHNYGLAADLKFLSPEAKAYAHANAARYGLVFPMGDEPWHVEPIGAKAKRGKK